MLRLLNAGCHLPVGVLALPHQDKLRLMASVLNPDGCRVVRADRTGRFSEPERLAAEVADSLLERGAGDILAGLPRYPTKPPAS